MKRGRKKLLDTLKRYSVRFTWDAGNITGFKIRPRGFNTVLATIKLDNPATSEDTAEFFRALQDFLDMEAA